jgi:ABC-type transport system involved in cytochrome c biogenesis permease subunit
MSWLPVKIVAVLAMALALTAAIFLVARPFTEPGAGLLLSLHAFTITLGYGTALLLGVLGACFVLQRACADFPPARLPALSMVTFRFATVAIACTALGVFLGMLWAHREWNRFWAWDSKEIGGFCVLMWMTVFLVAHRFHRITPRALLIASTLGSNVVLLAWFARILSPTLHPAGLPAAAFLLLGAILFNLFLTLVGLAPAGCLRLRKS